MYPFSEDELERLCAAGLARRTSRLADLVLIDGWTGLRWSELRAIRVRDFVELPMPMLIVQRAEPEGVATKGTKSGKTRRVPVADRVLPIVRELARGPRAGCLAVRDRVGPPAARHRVQAHARLGGDRRGPADP